jgi:hypothetical protein
VKVRSASKMKMRKSERNNFMKKAMSLTAVHPAGRGTILISPTRKPDQELPSALPKTIHTAEEGKKRES